MKPNIDYVSVLDHIKSIPERNKAFDALDNQSKRLEIAWDALKLVNKKVVVASNCFYWDFELIDIANDCNNSKQLQKILNKPSNFKNCAVCARGSIMLSLIRLGNSIDPYDPHRDSGNKRNLKGFSMKSMVNMESEYERSEFNHPYKNNTDEKLMNILCNILVNGDFNIKDKTDYLIP